MRILSYLPANHHSDNAQSSAGGTSTPPQPDSPAANGHANNSASTETTATNADAAQTPNGGPKLTAERLSRPKRATNIPPSPQKQSGKESTPVEIPQTQAVPSTSSSWNDRAYTLDVNQSRTNTIYGPAPYSRSIRAFPKRNRNSE